MCQTERHEWKDEGILRPLLRLNGEPIIARTLRQLSSSGLDVIITYENDGVLASSPYWKYHKHLFCFHEGCPVMSAIRRLCSSSEGEELIFLFGDTIYSNYAISVILSNLYLSPDVFNLYGRLSGNLYTGKLMKEIFALHVRCNEESITELSRQSDTASLWSLWGKTKKIIPIADYTDDVDTRVEYNLFFKRLEQLAKHDDTTIVLH